tara:strand:- start:2883 stop:3257 length:375 start_codon:yes stop_codon:yes gene_type:complete
MDKVTDVFNSLYSAVVQAQKEVEGKYIENIQQTYFEDGKPKTIGVVLGGKSVEVPIFSLVPHNALKIAECEIDFEIDLNFNKEATGCFGKLRKNKMANVKIKFTGCDQAEGLARIGDGLTKIIP